MPRFSHSYLISPCFAPWNRDKSHGSDRSSPCWKRWSLVPWRDGLPHWRRSFWPRCSCQFHLSTSTAIHRWWMSKRGTCFKLQVSHIQRKKNMYIYIWYKHDETIYFFEGQPSIALIFPQEAIVFCLFSHDLHQGKSPWRGRAVAGPTATHSTCWWRPRSGPSWSSFEGNGDGKWWNFPEILQWSHGQWMPSGPLIHDEIPL